MIPFDIEGDPLKYAGSPMNAYHFSCKRIPHLIFRVVDRTAREAFGRLWADDPCWHDGAIRHPEMDCGAFSGEPKYPFFAVRRQT